MTETIERKIVRFEDDSYFDCHDTLIREKHVTLRINGQPAVTVVMTSGDESFWALGFLRCSGFIEDCDDVERISCLDSIDVYLKKNKEGRKPPVDDASRTAARFSPEAIRRGVLRMAEAKLYRSTGSTHVAALMAPSGEIPVIMEDIGRHNAVDKAVGWAIDRRMPLSGLALLTSGRLPTDMVEKAVACRVPLLASVSAATAQGVETAERADVTLIGFVRGNRMNVYSHPWRIIEEAAAKGTLRG